MGTSRLVFWSAATWGQTLTRMMKAVLLAAALVACSALETKVEADMKYDILSGGEVVPSGKFACQTRCKTECSMVPPKAYPLRTLQLSRQVQGAPHLQRMRPPVLPV